MAFALEQTLSLSENGAGVTQLAECLLPKSERLSAVGPRVGVRPNRFSYTLPVLALAAGHVATATADPRRRDGWASQSEPVQVS